MTRNSVASAVALLGIGLFIFCLFGFGVQAGTNTSESLRSIDAGGGPVWKAAAGYPLSARIGLAVGAVLAVAGFLMRAEAER